MGVVASFEKLSDAADRVVTGFVVILLLGLTAVVTLQIVARVFFEAFSWTEELSRFLGDPDLPENRVHPTVGAKHARRAPSPPPTSMP